MRRSPVRPLHLTVLIAVVTGGGIVVAKKDEPKEIVKAPSAWDDEAAAEFEAAGIPVPRTVMTTETQAPLDLAWIRDALGFAKPLPQEEVKRLEGSGRRELGGGEAPSTDAPPSDDAPEARPEPRREERRAVEAPRRARAVGNGRDKAKKKNGGGGGAADIPKPALTKIERAPRLAKILIQNREGKYESLVPRAMRVVTFIEGQRARTVVDLVFQNPHGRRLQGTLFYPLPDGASPAGFGMFPGTRRIDDEKVFGSAPLLPKLPDKVDSHDLASVAPQSQAQTLVPDWKPIQKARVVEQKRARQVYEEIVRKNVDPALLEWSGANTFRARVFPIEPKSVKRVVLAYEETLIQDKEVLRYLYPMPGQVSLGEIEAVVHLRDNFNELITGLKNDADGLRAPVGAAKSTGPWKRYRFVVPSGFRGALDVAVKQLGGSLWAHSGPIPGLKGRGFYTKFIPDIPSKDLKKPTGKALFLLDTSLSEKGARRNLSGQLLMQILKSDPTIKQFAVLLFDVRTRWLHKVGYRENTAANRDATTKELSRVYLEGATNFAAVLDEVQRQRAWIDADGAPAARFLLSDGLITWGLDKTGPLLKKYDPALAGQWFTYQFGDVPINRGLFDALSRRTAGRTVTVLGASQVEAASTAHRKAPVKLVSFKMTGNLIVDIVVAGDPKLVFPGQALEVAGRCMRTPWSPAVELTLDIEGQKKVITVSVDTHFESILAQRAWGELFVKRLLAKDDVRFDPLVVALSQAFGLANSAASLLILETDAEWKRYDLEKESAQLDKLNELWIKAEDQRRDKLLGIHVDDVPRVGRDLIRTLAGVKAKAFQPALPSLDRPLAGGKTRIAAEVAYRKARSKDELDTTVYNAIALARAQSGDTAGAVRAFSCLVEKRPRNAEANRLVGYACLSLGQYGPAAELFERVRLNRPFEPQSYLEEALALEALGRWSEAARNYEICMARSFPRHVNEVRTVARYHYARMLGGLLREGGLSAAQKSEVQARQAAVIKGLHNGLKRTALQLSIHWNTDSTDIDLWVVEPEGERCFYSHKETKAGGKLFWDTTSGYGPEIYRREKGGAGVYDVLVHFYGNNSARWTVPTAVLFVNDSDVFSAEDAYTRRFQMRLMPKAKGVLRLKKVNF